jgi:rare lipoprotein A
VTVQSGGRITTRFLPHADLHKGEFYVQVGSFTQKANALRLKKKLISWGKKVVAYKFDRGDKIFYRVLVRAGNTLNTARHVEKVMRESGFPDAFVVAR